MSERFTHDKARTEMPRLKDVPLLPPGTARDPSDGRDPQGRFLAGNKVATGHGWKALIRRGLGGDSETQRQAVLLFLAMLRSLPSDGPAVRQHVAAHARHAALAGFYATEADSVGLATPAGMALAEQARSHDVVAARFSTAAYDRAVREAKAKPIATAAWWTTTADDEPNDGLDVEPDSEPAPPQQEKRYNEP